MKASEQVRSFDTAAGVSLWQAKLSNDIFKQLAMKNEVEVLRRENRLMTSAYFDLSSRLQLNHVSLQRRSEPAKSWLNRQRQLVSQATAVRMNR